MLSELNAFHTTMCSFRALCALNVQSGGEEDGPRYVPSKGAAALAAFTVRVCNPAPSVVLPLACRAHLLPVCPSIVSCSLRSSMQRRQLPDAHARAANRGRATPVIQLVCSKCADICMCRDLCSLVRVVRLCDCMCVCVYVLFCVYLYALLLYRVLCALIYAAPEFGKHGRV